MRKIEKPTIKHNNLVNRVETTSSSYDYILKDHPELKGKYVFVSDEELEGFEDQDSTFKHPSSLFVAVALGRIYFRTNSRAKAQQICDVIFSGKYVVKRVFSVGGRV